MKYRILAFLSVAAALLVFISIPETAAIEDTEDVSIERYIEFEITFDHGDKLHIEAEILASPYPIAVFLIKGADAYEQWLDTEDVDINAIKNGTDVSDMNVSFQVVENFSEQNITSFDKEIDIGEQDTYYFVISLHRYAGMTTEDALTRASEVQYSVDWSIEEKDVPWYLLIFAAILFLIGAVLIAMYFYSIQKARSELREMEEAEQVRRPLPGRGPPRERPPVRGRGPSRLR
jgi:hypothetical protein